MPIYLPKLIGHRGVKDLAPENTLYSIERAYKLNLSWIEIDVKISKDNIPFLLHDDDFFRTTLLKGNPIHYKYEDISKLSPMIGGIKTIMVAIVGIFLFGEEITLRKLISIALIVTGLFLFLK